MKNCITILPSVVQIPGEFFQIQQCVYAEEMADEAKCGIMELECVYLDTRCAK